MFAIVTSGVSLYIKVQISGKATYIEPDINDNGHERQPTPDRNEEKSLFQKIFQCFDVMDNYNRLFQLSSPNNFLSSIAGIRFVDMSMRRNSKFILIILFLPIFRTVICVWTIAFHINYHSAFTLDNIPQLATKMEYFMYQPIFQAYLYVDVFFVLRCDFIVNWISFKIFQNIFCFT